MSSLPRLAPSAKSAQGPLSQLHRQQALRASAPSINASFSSSASASSSASSSLPSSSSQPPPSDTTLTWDKYLNIRKQRVRYGLATTYPTAIASMFASGSYFLTQEVDPTNAIMGIDPVYVALLETIGTGFLGYLIGPMIGTKLWSIVHRKHAKDIEEKDRRFYEHILRKRCDPSRQTMQNRVVDFYGEKIGSRSEYRQWLRDQANYTRKAAHGVEDDLSSSH